LTKHKTDGDIQPKYHFTAIIHGVHTPLMYVFSQCILGPVDKTALYCRHAGDWRSLRDYQTSDAFRGATKNIKISTARSAEWELMRRCWAVED